MLKERFENKVTAARCAVAGVAVSAPLSLCTLTSFAAEGDPSVMDSVSESLISAVTSMAASIGSALGSIIPIAIPLVGIGLVVTIGLSVFKRVSSKA
ncbi:hypothetical protein [Enterocloster bolteae]|uniref:hypothetical protein n=1 Tax=Enterocloster bolteae TaxID=208479 RepID=UPI002A8374F1|nr:hypothetical protein [Enterocloster bolteae]